MLQEEGRPLILGGDGRADSPGHSAKYGTYTLMELEKCQVVDIQVVQVKYDPFIVHPLSHIYLFGVGGWGWGRGEVIWQIENAHVTRSQVLMETFIMELSIPD